MEGLTVWGSGCIIHSNDAEAAFLEQGRHLMLWNGDESKGVYIDKYDARSHLFDWREVDHESTRVVMSAEEVMAAMDVSERRMEKELDAERYRDITDIHTANKTQSNDNICSNRDNSTGAGSIGGNRDNSTGGGSIGGRASPILCPGSSADVAIEPFTMPFETPDDMENPSSKKHFDIIMHTALKTRQSMQLEIFLKVKQEGNGMFDFLRPAGRCNALYMYLKGLPDSHFWRCLMGRGGADLAPDGYTDACIIPSESTGAGSTEDDAKEGALSYLMAYSDSSGGEDEGGEQKPAREEGFRNDPDINQNSIVPAVSNMIDDVRDTSDADAELVAHEIAQKRALRLQRAKLLADRFKQATPMEREINPNAIVSSACHDEATSRNAEPREQPRVSSSRHSLPPDGAEATRRSSQRKATIRYSSHDSGRSTSRSPENIAYERGRARTSRSGSSSQESHDDRRRREDRLYRTTSSSSTGHNSYKEGRNKHIKSGRSRGEGADLGRCHDNPSIM